jgi:hypothetical protein
VDDFINRLLGITFGSVGALRDAVSSFARTIWGLVTAGWTVFLHPWDFIHGAVIALRNGVFRFVTASYTMARYLLFDFIPRIASSTLDYAVRWAGDRIAALQELAQALTNRAIDIARAWIDEVRSFVDGTIAWIHDRLVDVWTTLTFVAHLVGELLTSPDKLVDWLWGALVSRTMSWIDSNVDAVAAWAYHNAIAIVQRAADRLEHMIASIL